MTKHNFNIATEEERRVKRKGANLHNYELWVEWIIWKIVFAVIFSIGAMMFPDLIFLFIIAFILCLFIKN